MPHAATESPHWQPSACILCSRNCGIEVQLDGSRLLRVRGDERHPISQGYLCQKAARLEHYQNHADRLSSPLRRRPDGSFEEIAWDTALREIAARLLALKRRHGPRAFAFYGGGGQGNHLGGVYGRGLLDAMGSRFLYTALAQEKTGDFWVNGRLFGHQTCHVAEDVEAAEFVVFIGTNPYQAHGIRNARDTLRALGRDTRRTLVVIDPCRTETAALADVHLQLRPGSDAFLLAAMLGVIVQERLYDVAFVDARTVGFDTLADVLRGVPVDDYCRRAGVPAEDARRVARGLAAARSASVRVDLGLQHSPHSTLNSYLEKLLWLLPGHFARPGCNALHSLFVPLIGHSPEPGPGSPAWTTTVTGQREISRLFPPSVLPEEIDNEHEGRLRALFVDSANPALSAADSQAYRRALARLELLVVVDVAFTETARLAHYILPAASQFEKAEATFFQLDFPRQGFHLRRPLLSPRPGTLPEPEIYRRLLVAMGVIPERFLWLRALARLDRRVPKLRLFPVALSLALRLLPRWRAQARFVLYDTLGRTLPEGLAAAAPLWAAAHEYARRHPDAVRRAGVRGQGAELGEDLFRRLIESPSGALLSEHLHADVWGFVRHADGRIHLAVPELLEQMRALRDEPELDPAAELYPFVLLAGQRRAYNANQIYRDPAWRKTDPDGALHVHPEDARELGLDDGGWAACESARGRLDVRVRCTDAVGRGVVTLPHGYGMDYPDAAGVRRVQGPALNELTDARHRDAIAATPLHKHVRVRLCALGTAPPAAGAA